MKLGILYRLYPPIRDFAAKPDALFQLLRKSNLPSLSYRPGQQPPGGNAFGLQSASSSFLFASLNSKRNLEPKELTGRLIFSSCRVGWPPTFYRGDGSRLSQGSYTPHGPQPCP